jgi:hypothetical protein
MQDEAAPVTFRVTNDSPTASLTSVEFRIPEEFSIAEVIPMSVDDWGPSQTMRTITEPVTGLHGAQTTEIVATLTWTAMPGAELKPGATVQFTISMFVLPRTATFAIPVVLRFSDGSVINHTGMPGAATTAGERPAPVATLAPPAAAPADAGDDGAEADEAAAGGNSNMLWMFILLVLIGGVAAFALIRQRRAEPLPDVDDSDDDDDDDLNDEATSSRERAAL